MQFHKLAVRVGKLLTDNSPTILTAVGVTGTLTTAFLTGKASFKAVEAIQAETRRIDFYAQKDLNKKEKVLVVWKLYLPAVGTGVITVTAIVCANRIGMRRAAAMAAAFSVSEKAWTEYRDKVVEKIGANKERDIRDELAQDRINRNPVGAREVIITGNGDVLCYDSITGRYFTSNVEALKAARNEINFQILHNMYASLLDFYNLIGLAPTDYSTEVGWNADELLELDFSTSLSEDGRPCISIGYAVFPVRGYNRLQ